MPTFVYFILGTLFVLFLTFPVNMAPQHKRVEPKLRGCAKRDQTNEPY